MKYLILCIFISPLFVFANPQTAKVVSGIAQFEGLDSAQLTVSPSDRAIIHWDSFSIDNQEITRFIQDSSDSAVLNRVMTHQVSQLNGMLQADGKVYLINPNGIVIGKDGVIDTTSFIGSTFDISNDAFLSGDDLHFTGDALSSIINEGIIEARDGNILLFAHRVENGGAISAKNGDVQIGSGHRIFLAMEGKELLLIEPELPGDGILNEGKIEALRVVLASHSNPYESVLQNNGEIEANSLEHRNGEIYLLSNSSIQNEGTLKSLNGKVYIEGEGSLSHRGLIEAVETELLVSRGELDDFTIQMEGAIHTNGIEGHILLKAEDGTVSVNGPMTALDGGAIHVLGPVVRLEDKAFLDASGASGGGTILIGGDYQGKNLEIPNAQFTYIDPSAVIQADCLSSGKGGKVIFWGDDVCYFGGKVSSRGGNMSGDGGLIEVSSHHDLVYRGTVDTKAPYGECGTLLLDPSDINISNQANAGTPLFTTSTTSYDPTSSASNVDAADLQTALGAASVTISTSAGTGGDGIIVIFGTADTGGAVALNWSTANTLTLNGTIVHTHDGASLTSSNSLVNFDAIVMTATGISSSNATGVEIEGTTISTVNGNITLTGTGGDTENDNVGVNIGAITAATIQSTGSGNITFVGRGGDGANTNEGVRMANASQITSSGTGNIEITGNGAGSATGNLTKGVTMLSGTDIIQTGTGTIGITGIGGLSVGGTAGSHGFDLSGSGSGIQSSGGGITIVGTGDTASTGQFNRGLSLVDGSITATNNASINITGTGGGSGGSSDNGGIVMLGAMQISSVNGNIGITATAGIGAGAGGNSAGISLTRTDSIQSSGTGSITVVADSTSATAANAISSSGAITSSGSGDISLTGDSFTGNVDIFINSTAQPGLGGATTGNITLNANTLSGAGTSNSIQGSGNFTIAPRTATGTIGINGAVGDLSLPTFFISSWADGFSLITIGRADGTGNVLSNQQAFTDPITIRGGAITILGGNTLSTAGDQKITLLGTSLTVTGNVSTNSGNIQIGPQSLTDSIGLGTGEGTFNLSNASLANISSTSGTLQFGRLPSESGDNSLIDINTTQVFANPIEFYGRSITVNGSLSAGINNVTFSIAQVNDGTFDLSNTITTTGTISASGGTNENATFDINQTGNTITITGGASGSNTLEAPDGANTWNITTDNTGTMSGGGTFTFSNIHNLTGGTKGDTFIFADQIGISGTLSGGNLTTPVNTLDYSDFSPNATVDFNAATQSGTVSNIGGGFTQIQSVIGNFVSSPSPPPAPSNSLSSSSPIASPVIAANASTSSDFYGSGSQGAMSFKGLMGHAASNVISMMGFVMNFPSLIAGGDTQGALVQLQQELSNLITPSHLVDSSPTE